MIFLVSFILFSAEAAKQKPLPKEQMLKYPIILVHGATMGKAQLEVGPVNFGDYFRNIPKYLTRLGARVYVPSLSTDSSFDERGHQLAKFIREKTGSEKVNIVAHSLGGLDARYLVSRLKFEGVASITTIATSHRGTPMANYAAWAGRSRGLWYNLFKFFGYDLSKRRYINELTTEFMSGFNAQIEDRSDIRYFSVVAHGEPWWWNLSPLLWWTYFYTRFGDGTDNGVKNDGLVPIDSQPWGEVIGVVPLDHLAQMNHHPLRWPLEDQSLKLYHLVYQNLLDHGF